MTQKYPLPQQVPQWVAQRESNGNPNAVSPAGAQGVMQLMPATGQELYSRYGQQQFPGGYKPFDANQNRYLGTQYLQQLHTQFQGNLPATLAAYHSGPGRVSQLQAKYGDKWQDFLGPVGRDYVKKGTEALGGSMLDLTPQYSQIAQQFQPNTAQQVGQIAGQVQTGAQAVAGLTGSNVASGLGSAAGAVGGVAGLLDGQNSLGEYAATGAQLANQAQSVAPSASWLGTAGTALGGIAGAYGMYELTKDWGTAGKQGGRTPMVAGMRTLGGAAAGAGMGLAAGAAMGASLGPVGAAVGAVVGLASSLAKSGKHGDQDKRDAIRAGMQDSGLLDENHNLKLADGSTFNLGVDGGKRGEWGGRRPYELDAEELQKNPELGQVVAWADPLAEALVEGMPADEAAKFREQMSGYLVKAATGSADPRGKIDLERAKLNLSGIMKQMGIDPASATARFDQMVAEGRIDAGRAAVYKNSLGVLAGAKTSPQSPQASRGEQRQSNRPTRSRKRKKGQPEAPTGTPPAAPTQVPEIAQPGVFTIADYVRALEQVNKRNQL